MTDVYASLGIPQGNAGSHAIPNSHQIQQQQQALGPPSIVQVIPSSIQHHSSSSTNPGAASLSLHGAGNGSTKSMNKIRNKTIANFANMYFQNLRQSYLVSNTRVKHICLGIRPPSGCLQSDVPP